MVVEDHECRKDADTIDLEMLRDWLNKQPHLPKDFDNNILMAFLNQTKSIERAKEKIDGFCTYRTKMPHLFEFPYRDILDPAFKEACEFTNIFFLPKLTPEGYSVMMIKGHNAEKIDHHLLNMRILMMLEVALEKWPNMKGLVGVVDVIGSDNSIVPKLKIPDTLKCLQYVQEVMPLKLKHIIVYNTTAVTEFVLNSLIKPILKGKILKRLVVTTEDERCIETIFPLEMLPNDCIGGKGPSIKELNDEWLKILEEKRSFFLKYSKFCSDESQRPANSKNMVDGSFRYLTID